MNFLPFVVSLLILLTIISSFMFSSVIGTARGKEVILSHHQAYLSLISSQNKKLYEENKPPPITAQPKQGKKKPLKQEKKFTKHRRDRLMGIQESKINLWPMIHGNHPEASKALQSIVAQLITDLYSSSPFFNSKEIALTLVQEMVSQKIEKLEALSLKDPQLDAIYYKLLKGTNTGYPPLSEYCRLEKQSTPPIHFRYARAPILQAALGKELSQKVLDLEKKQWQQHGRWDALNKDKFQELVQNAPACWIKLDLVPVLFEFKKKKGAPQILKEDGVKIRAVREVKKGSS